MYLVRPSAAPAPLPLVNPVSWRAGLSALAVALLLQSTLVARLRFHDGTFGLVLLVCVWFAMRAGTWRAVLFGLIAGILEDAIAGWTGAAWTLATPFATAFVGRIGRTTLGETAIVSLPVVAVASVLRSVVFWFALRAFRRPFVLDEHALHGAVWSALLTAALAGVLLLMFPPLRPLHVERH